MPEPHSNEQELVDRAERLLNALERSKHLLQEQANVLPFTVDISELKVKLGKIDVTLELFKDVKLDVLKFNVDELLRKEKAREDKRWAVWLMVLGVILANVWPLIMLVIRK